MNSPPSSPPRRKRVRGAQQLLKLELASVFHGLKPLLRVAKEGEQITGLDGELEGPKEKEGAEGKSRTVAGDKAAGAASFGLSTKGKGKERAPQEEGEVVVFQRTPSQPPRPIAPLKHRLAGASPPLPSSSLPNLTLSTRPSTNQDQDREAATRHRTTSEWAARVLGPIVREEQLASRKRPREVESESDDDEEDGEKEVSVDAFLSAAKTTATKKGMGRKYTSKFTRKKELAKSKSKRNLKKNGRGSAAPTSHDSDSSSSSSQEAQPSTRSRRSIRTSHKALQNKRNTSLFPVSIKKGFQRTPASRRRALSPTPSPPPPDRSKHPMRLLPNYLGVGSPLAPLRTPTDPLPGRARLNFTSSSQLEEQDRRWYAAPVVKIGARKRKRELEMGEEAKKIARKRTPFLAGIKDTAFFVGGGIPSLSKTTEAPQETEEITNVPETAAAVVEIEKKRATVTSLAFSRLAVEKLVEELDQGDPLRNQIGVKGNGRKRKIDLGSRGSNVPGKNRLEMVQVDETGSVFPVFSGEGTDSSLGTQGCSIDPSPRQTSTP